MSAGSEHALVQVFQDTLLEARRRALRTVVDTEEELATLEPHQPGSFVQESAREEALAVLGRLDGRERRALEDIDAALARLRAGTFGLCEGCRGEIAFTRLHAVPTARFCVLCQAERERSGSA